MNLQELDALREICVPLNTLLPLWIYIICQQLSSLKVLCTVPCVCMVARVQSKYGIQIY